MKKIWLGLALFLAGCYGSDKAKSDIYLINADGLDKNIGVITLQDSAQGLELNVDLQALPKGEHGFHIHEFGDCGAAADKDGKMMAGLKAGGHYDPQKTDEHFGPDKAGHKGDLPYLTADDQGVVKSKIYAPHLKVKDVKGRALMIHAGGDNYQDKPLPLGGGGARIACGIIESD